MWGKRHEMLKLTVLHQAEAKGGTENMLASLGSNVNSYRHLSLLRRVFENKLVRAIEPSLNAE